MAETQTAKAKVFIELEIDAEYVSDFIAEWDDLVQKLIEHAGINAAKLELPKGAKSIELSRW